MRRKKKVNKEAKYERWLLAYSDIITILMIFFVIMYYIGNVDKGKFVSKVESLKRTFGVISTTEKEHQKPKEDMSLDEEKKIETEFSDLKVKVDKYIKENSLTDSVVATENDKGLVISFKDNILFNPGEDELKEEYLDDINEVGKIIQTVDSFVRVEGHTDSIKMSNDKFKSNWELSSARANAIVHLLIDNNYVIPKKVSSVGYSEYRPEVDNNTDTGREKNRRVDIVLLNKKYEAVER